MDGNPRVVLYSRVSTNNGQDPEVQFREIRLFNGSGGEGGIRIAHLKITRKAFVSAVERP